MTNSKAISLCSAVLLIVGMLCSSACGASGKENDGAGGPNGPDRAGNPPPMPSEAYAACSGKNNGDTCTATMHDRTMTGTCRKSPGKNDTRLACVPPRPEGDKRPDGPPPENNE